MSTQSNAVPDARVDSQVIAPAVVADTRPMFWSIQREFWENRFIYAAPLAASGIVLFGFFISTVRRSVIGLDPSKQFEVLSWPYVFAPSLIMGASFLAGLFYCLDALHGERRDRSILFWKSLPVSDLTTVLAKAGIAIVILPLLNFAITFVTQAIMLLVSSMVLLANGLSIAPLWTHLSMYQMSLMLLYHLVSVHILWYAPIYAWLLLVSGWARRATLVWAALPPFAIAVIEKIAFNTSHFARMLSYRLIGPERFEMSRHGGEPMYPMTTMDPGKFLSSPGLWLGLAAAAVFLALAVRVRRYREPI
ncbi:MAG TPA: ABC transporter permease [Terriglobales bacterium]|nr:ABC transporter permease [Terriglobales bacterium]